MTTGIQLLGAVALQERTVPVCLCPWSENPHRLVSLWDMYQIYAHKLFEMFDELRSLDIELGKSLPQAPSPEEEAAVSKKFLELLTALRVTTELLQLTSSRRQVGRIFQ